MGLVNRPKSHHRGWMVLLMGVAVCGLMPSCRNRGYSGAPDAGNQALQLQPNAPPEEAAHLRLDSGVLHRFIAYQKALLEPLPQTDAGSERMSLVEQEAIREEEARKKYGLAAAQVDALEDMVSDILEPRMMAKSLDTEKLLSQGEVMREKLPPEARKDFDAELEPLRSEVRRFKELKEERTKYGNEAVDLILSREAELESLWNAKLERLMKSDSKSPH